ncbi:ATP synthase F1, delta subunit [Coccidioides immitis RS]|uniref:ATP synthase subunit 5, mitochondrial n=4 Tax=Coccidioides TaxID=5500 RepID=A0A0E1RXL4_COCIM|nr:ATP synthase F1, delta subunit [Coccidioides immitis RS]XP_003067527.1 ATP synthase oligomycin sensitivity conferral protein, putative [Coccidioides posadasii C735 delta SOWgp]EFW17667.1 ATP synthase oligomycin sensitivity conferral protein [Coccidioides posadasii str. Silveira]KMM70689.1 ATP synthase subunit 5 [Coccidioides posadasii RMSCC 3488]EAS34192.1 ATP synthase F1, delta subunit [Coccidioides immitis RS]EER25382.1 ATP synthase oligomycin sensitivity conferral protein, putative [Cocc|eukprot:XP_003067527.1 ATP synthase oligomycin sensitivity conferral protein, putative [Coccidioides posadasii C735 delta SOWgp]
MLSSRVVQASLRASAQQFSRRAAINGVRTYAAPAQDSKPPVALFGVDGTYANALYTASAKTSSLEQTSKALASLGEVFKKDAKLTSILNAPTLSQADKAQIIAELQKVAGGAGKGDILKNFLNTLAENNRLGLLQGVCEKFATLMGAYRGEIELIITSAQKLDQKTLQRLENAVAKSEYSQGKKLKVVTKINSDVVGGLIVEIGDRTIDLSVSSKMAKLNKALTDAL